MTNFNKIFLIITFERKFEMKYLNYTFISYLQITKYK